MRPVFPMLLALLCSLSANAQFYSRYQSVLDSVKVHSPRVLSLRATMTAEQEGSRQENVLEDPSLELGYLWGDTDHRVDLAVSQSFEFPTVYLHRRKAVRQEIANAQLRYRMALREVLLQAVQLCVEWENYDALIALTRQQCEMEQERLDAVTTLYHEGAATIIAHNRAVREHQRMQQELVRLQTERAAVVAELSTVAGCPIDSIRINEIMLLHLDDSANMPSMDQQYAVGQVTQAEAAWKAARSQWWPGLTLGYYSEKEPDNTFRGMKIGLSLPAWNNRHRVRQTKAALAAARYDAIDRQAQLQQRIETLQIAYQTCQQQANDTRRLLDEQDMVSLLNIQLKEGAITRPVYLEGRIACMEDEKEWLNLQREALLKLAELESISFQPE